MKAAIYISKESGHEFLFLFTIPYTHQFTICAHAVLSALWNFPKLTVGFSISNRMMFYSGEILHRAEITLFIFIYLFTQCQKLLQITHKDELILSSNNFIRQCLFLASSIDVTAELGNFSQLSRVRHFVGGMQAVKIQHLCYSSS